MILVVVGLSIVAVTLAVVAEPDKPATNRRWNLRGRTPPVAPVAAPTPTTTPAPAPSPRGRGVAYRPPRWWERLRSIVLLVILATVVGATVAAILGAVLALIGLGVREAVS